MTWLLIYQCPLSDKQTFPTNAQTTSLIPEYKFRILFHNTENTNSKFIRVKYSDQGKTLTKVESTMVRTPRSRRGISPILATLLLVVIAVAAIVITYAWVMTFTGGATGQAGVWLDYDAVSWNAGNITIYLRNKGTSDAEIDAVYVGTSYENLEEQTSVTYSPSTIIEKDGGTITIAIDYLWSSDTRYYFTIAPKLGQALKFEKQAP